MAGVVVVVSGVVSAQEPSVVFVHPAPVIAAESECLIAWRVRYGAVASRVCPETDTPLSLCPGQGPGSSVVVLLSQYALQRGQAARETESGLIP